MFEVSVRVIMIYNSLELMLNLLVKIIFEIKINCARRVRIRFKRRSPKSSKCFNKPPAPEWWETYRSRMRNFKVCLINISLLVCQSFQRESQRRRAGKRHRKGEMEICTDHLADCWTLPMSYVLYFFFLSIYTECYSTTENKKNLMCDVARILGFVLKKI